MAINKRNRRAFVAANIVLQEMKADVILDILPFTGVIFSFLYFGWSFLEPFIFSLCHFKIRKSLKQKIAFFLSPQSLSFLNTFLFDISFS